MENEQPIFDSVIELKPPTGLYDTGSDVWAPKINNAVESMISTGCVVVIYHRRSLDSLYRNVFRRNEKLNPNRKRGDAKFLEKYKLWTHQLMPTTSGGDGKWIVRVRREGEIVNPFYAYESHSKYGKWLVLADKLLNAEDVTVANQKEARCVAQSFRFLCDRRGFFRDGRMLRTSEAGKVIRVSLVKPLRKKEDVLAEIERRNPLPKKKAKIVPSKSKKTRKHKNGKTQKRR